MRRNTVQKELVLSAVRALHSHVTAEDVYNFIIKDHPSVGRGTVYRNLNILSEEGSVKKVEIPEGPDRYDFTVKDHYHVRCIKCGCVEDADLSEMPDLLKKVNNSHGFELLGFDILFTGVCEKCRQGAGEKRESDDC